MAATASDGSALRNLARTDRSGTGPGRAHARRRWPMGERGRAKELRCAIYTRKSSEEGLEQDFNSLHAQREACEAYVTSQKHEGWRALANVYDDGGFSGGSMERPGLTRLLADIASGTVAIVVVYKVDRLTRSLTDFARIVEVFDRYQVSFVSVTQAFNTTTSMGRLTLNVLLSFAQFERESRASASGTRLPPPSARGSGWAASSRSATRPAGARSSSTRARLRRCAPSTRAISR